MGNAERPHPHSGPEAIPGLVPDQLPVPDTAKVQLWAGQYSAPTVVYGALTCIVPRQVLHAPLATAPFGAMLSVMVLVSLTVEHLLIWAVVFPE